MKLISRIITIISILILCLAALPAKTVQAYYSITTDTVWSIPTGLTTDLVITSGATLTIQDIDVGVFCSDASPYAPGASSTLIEVIVEDGALIMNNGGSFYNLTGSGDACWYGIRVLDEGYAELDGVSISGATRGVSVENGSAILTNNTINGIYGVDSSTNSTRTAYGIVVTGADSYANISGNLITNVYGGAGCTAGVCTNRSGANAYGIFAADFTNAIINENSISSIHGGNGVNGVNGAAGANGAAGTSNAPAGVNGSAGDPGENGGNGGDAFGIMTHTLSGQVLGNLINNVIGGNGGIGGRGGAGGHGGAGYNWTAPYQNLYDAEGGFGGNGGNSGVNGIGGNGGNAYGLFIWNSELSINATDISYVRSGVGSPAGSGATGGNGGAGGNGTPILINTVYNAGYGGWGGKGGDGSPAGIPGNSGEALGVRVEASTLESFDLNYIKDIASANGGSGAFGGTGGSGGKGGNGGLNNQTGNTSYHGGGGGSGWNGGTGSIGGKGGYAGDVYGVFMQNVDVESISRTMVETLNSGTPGVGGRSGQGGIGGLGGNASATNPVAAAGNGGTGGDSLSGGNGGDSADVYGIFLSDTPATLVNNIINTVQTRIGANGGTGYNGGNAGNGGNGYTRPGGNGGRGGMTGPGGDGGMSGSALGTFMESATSTDVFLMNNTIVDVISPSSTTAAGGAAGTIPGTGGAGGTGTPAGIAGAAGSLGSAGTNGVIGNGYGVAVDTSCDAVLYNNIIATFEAASTNNIGISGYGVSNVDLHNTTVYGWNMNLTADVAQGINYLSTNPQFIDPLVEEDLHLASASPCIDSGDNGIPTPLTLDYDGTPRPLDGDANGSEVIDRGAYEYGNFFAFESGTLMVNEDGVSIDVIVKRIGYYSAISYVDYYTEGITAIQGTDYTGKNNMIAYPSGAGGVEHVIIQISNDSDIEGPETFSVNLTNPVNGRLGSPQTVIITIIDDEVFLSFLPLLIR